MGLGSGSEGARNLPLGEGASSTNGPDVSSWSCASCSSTTSSVREEVASTTSGRRGTGLAAGAALPSRGGCSRHMAVGAEVRCGSARGTCRRVRLRVRRPGLGAQARERPG